jgi:tetratricopeptide (TPR) repeat protein
MHTILLLTANPKDTNLALLYEAQGNYPKAKELYEQAIPILLKTLGERHPTTQTVKRNYLDCLAKMQPRRRWWQFWKWFV